MLTLVPGQRLSAFLLWIFAARLWCGVQQVRSIWLLIYPLMGVSSWRIYMNPEPHAVALLLYMALLVATWLCWPPILLPHKPQAGLLDLAGTVPFNAL